MRYLIIALAVLVAIPMSQALAQYDYEYWISFLQEQRDWYKNKYHETWEELRDRELEIRDLRAEIRDLREGITRLGSENNELKFKPRTVIEGTTIEWHFYDSKENYYLWEMPITTYEELLVASKAKSEYLWHNEALPLSLNGETHYTIRLDGFVRESFTKTVDTIYDNSYDNPDFVYEVWYIVSQMTVYDKDVSIDSEGRFALETFTRGGGDCEDLAILIADMLKSSKYTKDWTIQYVYMDLDNPRDPKEANHVALYVNDGIYNYYIEATGPPNWDRYPNGIYGWYFDVV